MRKITQLGILTLLLYVIVSCNSKSEREIEIEKIKDNSIEILAKIKTNILIAENQNKTTWQVNIDSIQNEWEKIHSDSAELGLKYLQDFENIFNSKTDELVKQSEIENAKEKKELEMKFENLKKKFSYKKDEFQDIGFYSHKTWGKYWPNRKTLTSGVNSSGYAWLRSNYSASDWIFHTSIYVLIDDKKLTSPIVETYNENNITKHDGGRIWEVVTYDNTNILQEIAMNTDKTIKVRFNGTEFYDDITLSSKDKKALKDCYDLAKMIKELKEYEN